MKFSNHLRNKILEKYGDFGEPARILGVPRETFARWLGSRKSARKIWLWQIDEWDEKLGLSILEARPMADAGKDLLDYLFREIADLRHEIQFLREEKRESRGG